MLAEVGHVVVVDDDPSLRQMVTRYLEDHNVPTKSASNRTELNRHLEGTQPCLIILDLRLGQDDGLDLLREIRSRSDVPIIITTGHRPEEIDRIVGLELGADDYIVKPFSLRELLARGPGGAATAGNRTSCTCARPGAGRLPFRRLAA
jgi:two-component system, OmpR family, response regulator